MMDVTSSENIQSHFESMQSVAKKLICSFKNMQLFYKAFTKLLQSFHEAYLNFYKAFMKPL